MRRRRMQKINSVHNKHIKAALKLLNKKHTTDSGEFLVPHHRLLKQASKADYKISIIFALDTAYSAAAKLGNTIVIPPYIMSRLVPNYTNCQMVGVCQVKTQLFCPSATTLLLDRIQDPGNMGTLLRSALSFGFKNIALINNCVNIYNMKVIVASQGAMFACNIINYVDAQTILTKLQDEDYAIIGTTAHAPSTFNISSAKNNHQPIALCLGNEGNGLCSLVLNNINQNWWLPLRDNVESLNVGVAGSILMYLYYDRQN